MNKLNELEEIINQIPENLTVDNIVNFLKPYNQGAKTDQDIRMAMQGTDNLTKTTVIMTVLTSYLNIEQDKQESKDLLQALVAKIWKRLIKASLEEDRDARHSAAAAPQDPAVIAQQMQKYLEEQEKLFDKGDGTFDYNQLTPVQQSHYKFAKVFSDPKNVRAYNEYHNRVIQSLNFGMNACANAIIAGADVPLSPEKEAAVREISKEGNKLLNNVTRLPEHVKKCHDLDIDAPVDKMAKHHAFVTNVAARAVNLKALKKANETEGQLDNIEAGETNYLRKVADIEKETGFTEKMENWFEAAKDLGSQITNMKVDDKLSVSDIMAKHINKLESIPEFVSTELPEKVSKEVTQTPSATAR